MLFFVSLYQGAVFFTSRGSFFYLVSLSGLPLVDRFCWGGLGSPLVGGDVDDPFVCWLVCGPSGILVAESASLFSGS